MSVDPILNTASHPIDMSEVLVDPSWSLRIPASLARRRKAIPCCQIDGEVLVACADPEDSQMLDSLERHLQCPIKTVLAEEESLDQLIGRVFGGTASQSSSVRVAAQRGDDSAVVICDELIQAASIRGASDIHIDPGSEETTVRLRVNGELEDYKSLSSELHPLIASRLKVLGGMDISERRAAQDGRFAWSDSQGKEIDVRAASLPTRNGEALTLRLLGSRTEELTLEKLGMSLSDLKAFAAAINKPHGMILLTGPTGSGKSTTLYGGIKRLISERSLHVVTVEDPIEYEMDGVAQVSVDSADKVSFSKALRSILRHDPDVIMIGEIRDQETADIAIKSSLTGHLVLSSLHTNSAISAVTRLTDMGVESYLSGATLRLVVAQRLVRELCQRCREPRKLTQAEAIGLGNASAAGEVCYEAKGCLYCAGRGVIGRIGIYEMLSVDEDLSRAIAEGKDEATLSSIALQSGFRRLVDDALTKVLDGRVTPKDALSAVTVF